MELLDHLAPVSAYRKHIGRQIEELIAHLHQVRNLLDTGRNAGKLAMGSGDLGDALASRDNPGSSIWPTTPMPWLKSPGPNSSMS